MKKIFERLKYVALGAVVLPLALTGCQAEKESPEGWGEDGVRMRFAVSRLSGEGTSEDDARIGSLTGFRVVDGQIVESFVELNIDENGWCALKPKDKKGTMYFVANGAGAAGLNSVKTLDELLALELSGKEMTSEGVAMTGKLNLQTAASEVKMKRSVARVDVDARSAGVEVKEVVLKNVADKGMLWNETSVPMSSESAQTVEREFSFDTPVAGVKQTLCYLYEQTNSNLAVHIVADVEGVSYELDTKLPVGIRRNTVYTLKVNGVGGKLDVEVQEADWGNTTEVEAGEEKLEFTVDTSGGFPAGVSVNDRLDQVTVPYTDVEFDLVMNTIAGTELEIAGAVDGVEITPITDSRAAGNQLKVHVKNKLKSFTDLGGSIQLKAVNTTEGVSVGEIVLNFEANPCRLTGDLVFDENNYCRFDKQMEGELGVLFVPEGMKAELRFDTPENENGKEWMKMEQRIDGSYRLLAGWCSTFKREMNGKTEAVQLVIMDEQGRESVYTITRPYWSIPTVLVDGKYWSMFPMVGNSKNIQEQIMDEYLPGDLITHLRTCSDEEFIRLQGTHYQGGNPNGLTIYYDEGKKTFAYKGFSEAAFAMNTVKDEDMLPEGWRLPTQSDMSALSWGANAWLPYKDGVDLSRGGKRHRVFERKNVMVGGQNYGTAYIWAINKDGSWAVTFSGFRTQQRIGGISGVTSILPAAIGPDNKPWELCISGTLYGLAKYNFYAGLSTYTMHSIKVAPEYIYE